MLRHLLWMMSRSSVAAPFWSQHGRLEHGVESCLSVGRKLSKLPVLSKTGWQEESTRNIQKLLLFFHLWSPLSMQLSHENTPILMKYWLVWFISIPMAQEATKIASLFRKTHRQGKPFLMIQLAMDVMAILSHYQVYHQFWYLKLKTV